MPIHPEVLWCPNSRGNGWKFPRAVEKQIRKDTEGKSVLHLFGGRAAFGVRIDIDPITNPDVIADAWLPPFGRDSFDVVVLDPPYVHVNAQMKCALFSTAGWIARERVMWFSTLWESAAPLIFERAWLVRVGDSCHVRALQYFRPSSPKKPPSQHITRGPGMKYNRWRAQPQGLPFGGTYADPS